MQHYKDNSIKIKQYGQVFSGKRIGELLVSMLPKNLVVKSIIDPMVGRGDLLQAAYTKYPQADKVLGIDIDVDVRETCKSAVPKAEILIKDAFKSDEVNITGGWGLVITNPPYIRYQTLKKNPEIGLPDGKELRESLINHIQNTNNLDDQERQIYIEVSKRYSGLSDMAVPSWILCASIVKKGGYMAMVVPETWLNRDYAMPIHYLLLRCFEVVAIARDVESVWFEDAEIRTCLVICKRKENEPIRNSYPDTVLLELKSGIIDKNSLVGSMKFNGYAGYEALNYIIYSKTICSVEGFSSKIIPAMELFPGLTRKLNDQKWICKEDKMRDEESAVLPNEIREIVNSSCGVEYDSLEDLGWSVGQGLRTGANDFFYAQLLSSDRSMSVAQTESWYNRNIMLSSDNIRKAFKKRSDVNGLVVNYDDLHKCIFYIQHQVRQVDYLRLSKKTAEQYTLMDSDLDAYITQGERYISPVHKKPFRELSAVITNEKKIGDEFERFWYMLPELKERHVPNLCISRVCGESPEAIFIHQVPGSEIIVDANFITLWNLENRDQIIALALFNSTWAKLFLEVVGTAMGGGALKIEASHVRKIVFPRIDDKRKTELEHIGKEILINRSINRTIQKQIDEIVTSPFGDENSVFVSKQLEMLLIKKVQERTRRKYDE